MKGDICTPTGRRRGDLQLGPKLTTLKMMTSKDERKNVQTILTWFDEEKEYQMQINK